MNAVRPSRFRASVLDDGVHDVEPLCLVGGLRLRQPDPDDEGAGAVDHVHQTADASSVLPPPDGAAEGVDRHALGETRHVGLVVVAAEAEHDRPWAQLLQLCPDLLEPVDHVRPREPGRDASVDAADRLDRGARAGRPDDREARRDDERVAGNPQAELLARRERELSGARASAWLIPTWATRASSAERAARSRCRSRPRPTGRSAPARPSAAGRAAARG